MEPTKKPSARVLKNTDRVATRPYMRKADFKSEEEYKEFIKARRKVYNRKYYLPKKSNTWLTAGEDIMVGAPLVISNGRVFNKRRTPIKKKKDIE